MLAELGAGPARTVTTASDVPTGQVPLVLLVLTQHYFADSECGQFWPAADDLAARGRIRLVPLLVERLPLPPPLRDYQYLDLTRTTPTSAVDLLRHHLRSFLVTEPAEERPVRPPRIPPRAAVVVGPDDAHLAAPLAGALHTLPESLLAATSVWRVYRPTAGESWAAPMTVSLITLLQRPSAEPEREIHPEDADLVVVCVSRNLINHGYLESPEFARIRARQSAGRTVVIPILLAPVPWESLPPGHVPALPRGKPLSRWENRDDGIRSIVDGVRLVCQQLSEQRRAGWSRPVLGDVTREFAPPISEDERTWEPPPVEVGRYALEEVFKRSGTPTLTFVEPPDFARFVSALRAPGRGIVLEGPSGIGKTTLLVRAIERLDPRLSPTVLSGRRRADLPRIARLPDGHQGTIAVDDVHRLPHALRTELVDYLKVLADEESDSKLILIGIPGTGDSLVQLGHDVATRIDVFRLPAVSDATIDEMIRKGEQALNIAFADRSQIVLAAAGSLLTAQMLCWELAAGYRIERTRADRTPIATDIGLALTEVLKACERKYGPALRRFAALDGADATGCVALLAALRDAGRTGADGIVRVEQADRELWPGFATLAEKCPDGLGDVDAEAATHLHYDPSPGHLVVEDPQLLFYLRRLSVDRLYELVGKRRPRVRDQVFVSYSHRDQAWLERLDRHLRPLVRDRTIDLWSDRRVVAGDDWRAEIATALDRAQVAIVLVSTDFLISEFISEIELPQLLQAAAAGGCRIIPIVVNPCLFDHQPDLARFHAANSVKRPLTALSAHEQDEIFLNVALALKAELSR
ncbi:hypothetical protein GCM10020369_73550 [Cryptosporangium minutisporangium]|uniref:TIR domain-containing protein n=1 Tax=Cryptosporangium minutisporangium TaxID=113569 RepID=A0ABP6T9C7_9ACTN